MTKWAIVAEKQEDKKFDLLGSCSSSIFDATRNEAADSVIEKGYEDCSNEKEHWTVAVEG